MSQVAESLNKRLKRLREERGLSVKQMAMAIDVPVSTYREWEYGRGLRVPPFAKMAQQLGVPVTEIVTGTKAKNQEILAEIEMIEKFVVQLRQKMSLIS